MPGYGNDNYDQQSSGGFGNQAYGVNNTQGGGYGGPSGQDSNYSDNQSSQGGQYGHQGRYEEGDGQQEQYSDPRQHQNFGGGGGYSQNTDDDLSSAASHASEHAGDSGDSGMFSRILGMLGQNKQEIAQGDVDEQSAVQNHQQFFGSGNGNQEASSSNLGQAAAMQALKLFTSGASGNSAEGNSQNAFVGLAMGQASRLFDAQASAGNVAQGADKESAVNEAAQMALKMYLKSQGGSGGVMGLASKFF